MILTFQLGKLKLMEAKKLVCHKADKRQSPNLNPDLPAPSTKAHCLSCHFPQEHIVEGLF